MVWKKQAGSPQTSQDLRFMTTSYVCQQNPQVSILPPSIIFFCILIWEMKSNNYRASSERLIFDLDTSYSCPSLGSTTWLWMNDWWLISALQYHLINLQSSTHWGKRYSTIPGSCTGWEKLECYILYCYYSHIDFMLKKANISWPK